jgi:hypothetical protein
MKNTLLLLAAALVLLHCPQGQADIIMGPTITNGLGILDQNSGLEFYAKTNNMLTSFIYQNQGRADTISLESADGRTVYDTVNTPANQTSFTVNVNWSLTAGTEYLLLQADGQLFSGGEIGGGANGTADFANNFSGFPVSGTDLRIDESVYTNGGLSNFGGNWVDFNNITTVAAVSFCWFW